MDDLTPFLERETEDENHGFTMSAQGQFTLHHTPVVPEKIYTFSEYVALLDLLTGNPMVASSLNGAHGEWTNADDLSYSEIIMVFIGTCFLGVVTYVVASLPERHRAYEGDMHVEADVVRFHFEQVRDSVSGNHVAASQLNGNNGSHTGSDDVEGSGVEVPPKRVKAALEAARRRAKREAKNHQHQKPLNGARAEADAPPAQPEPPPIEVKEQPEEAVAAELVPEPVEETWYVSDMGVILIDGIIRAPLGESIIPSGATVNNVVRSSTGKYVTYEGKGESFVAEPILVHANLPEFANGTDAFRSSEYVVFIPLLKTLRRKLAGKQSPNTPAAASSLAQKDWPLINDVYITSTIAFFVRHNEYILSITIKGNADSRRLLGCPAIVDPMMENQVYELSLLNGESAVVPGVASRVNATDCNAPRNYPLRTDFIVTRSDGTSWDGAIGESPTVERDGYFSFHTEHGAGPRWYRTEFFKFRPTNGAQFVQYDATGINAAAGLKRMVGAREDQYALQAAQQRLVGSMTSALTQGCATDWDVSNWYKILRVMCTDDEGYTSRHGLELEPTEPHPEALPAVCQSYGEYAFYETQAAINRFHVSMIQSSTRSTLQHIADATLSTAKWAYEHTFGNLLEFMAPEFQRVSNAAIPHRSQRLRQEYVNGVLTHVDGDIMVRKLDAKVKNETAKADKHSRLYVSYGAGCMFENALPDYVKRCIKGWHVLPTTNGITGAICIVGSSKTSELEAIFEAAFRATGAADNYLAIAYSDDMCEMANLGGEVITADTDVESNDSSNGVYPFAVLGMCMASYNVTRACGILKQLMMPITIRNPSNSAESLEINMVGPFEGSGTVATTGVNSINSAGTCVGTFMYLGMGPRTVEGFCNAIKAGAAACGHTKSIKLCGSSANERPRMQFLKRSPLICTHPSGMQTTKMVTNLGCILRNFGAVDGDLTAKHLGVSNLQFSTMTDNERAHRYFSSVVRGLKHSPSCPIIRALRTRFNHRDAQDIDTFKILEDDEDWSEWTIDTADLCTRYECSDEELNELADLIGRCRVGYSYSCIALDKIFSVDYGLAPGE